jgi:ElaB/YqjD/DUF883 family membrane-anchored ribosome-binding protein
MSEQSERLAADIKVLVSDAEALVKATAAETGDKVVELRRRLQQTVDDLKPQLEKMEDTVLAKTRPAALATDKYVRAHPWPAIGVSALAGLVIGLLASRG